MSGQRLLRVSRRASVLALLSCSSQGGPSPDAEAGETSFQGIAAGDFGADTLIPRHAAPEDIHVFDPYIGRFRSRLHHDSDLGRDLHYVVEYAWFDSTESIVRFSVSTAYVAGGDSTVNAAGFYGYDPFAQRLYVFGVFGGGMTGFGAVGVFDRGSGRRETWARSRGPDGVTTHVKDLFELVDGDTWSDVTSVRRGPEGPWQVVYRDTFVRITP